MKQQWCIAEVGADFVWRMEDVLELYKQPYDEQHPVVCVDERPCQLLVDKQPSIPAEPGKPEREDFQYERNGTCNLFVAFQHRVGWRHVEVTERRTNADFAHWLKRLVDEWFPTATKIRLILDNLNIHSPAALYQTFEAQEARRILEKLEWHYTPKHGSWLNMVEIELSILVRQCLDRRLPDLETLRQEVQAWEQQRNAQKATIDWQFTSTDARVKLKRLYPEISPS
ncbi:transposase [Leptolyngbya boryana IAM M-101]|nr:transposase [Leptolyngbya boryana IAM M-101]BAS64800.1 transposase [Leptolyngbya boryana dg5]